MKITKAGSTLVATDDFKKAVRTLMEIGEQDAAVVYTSLALCSDGTKVETAPEDITKFIEQHRFDIKMVILAAMMKENNQRDVEKC